MPDATSSSLSFFTDAPHFEVLPTLELLRVGLAEADAAELCSLLRLDPVAVGGMQFVLAEMVVRRAGEEDLEGEDSTVDGRGPAFSAAQLRAQLERGPMLLVRLNLQVLPAMPRLLRFAAVVLAKMTAAPETSSLVAVSILGLPLGLPWAGAALRLGALCLMLADYADEVLAAARGERWLGGVRS